mgnify:CR=1 FL=1
MKLYKIHTYSTVETEYEVLGNNVEHAKERFYDGYYQNEKDVSWHDEILDNVTELSQK